MISKPIRGCEEGPLSLADIRPFPTPRLSVSLKHILLPCWTRSDTMLSPPSLPVLFLQPSTMPRSHLSLRNTTNSKAMGLAFTTYSTSAMRSYIFTTCGINKKWHVNPKFSRNWTIPIILFFAVRKYDAVMTGWFKAHHALHELQACMLPQLGSAFSGQQMTLNIRFS